VGNVGGRWESNCEFGGKGKGWDGGEGGDTFCATPTAGQVSLAFENGGQLFPPKRYVRENHSVRNVVVSNQSW